MSQKLILLRSKMNLRFVSQPMTAREINVVGTLFGGVAR